MEDAEGPTDESTTKLADVFPKVPLVPSTDPEHPDYLVKKAAGGQAKKTKGAAVSGVNGGEKDKGKSKETTPVVSNAFASKLYLGSPLIPCRTNDRIPTAEPDRGDLVVQPTRRRERPKSRPSKTQRQKVDRHLTCPSEQVAACSILNQH